MNKEVALIKSEAVINVIIADDSFIEHISAEYDAVIDVTGMSPRPGIGWSYIEGQFSIHDGSSIGDPSEELSEEPTE
jgi:hypothetical protein